MPEIMLTEGDFGADATVTFGSEALYLPDPDRPGLTMPVALAEVAEIDSINDDGLRPLKEALKLGAKGLLIGPAGLAAGFHSVTKVKDVVFSVVLQDGRQFVAVADAKAYAELHSAQVAARASARISEFGDVMPSPADDIIAKYLNAAEPPTAPAEPPPMEPQPMEPEPIEPAPAPELRRAAVASAERPVFGRRGSAK